jgi:hypothetical protein
MGHHPAIYGNPVIWDNMDGIGDHRVKWNKPGIERQMLHDLILVWNLNKLMSKELRVE